MRHLMLILFHKSKRYTN